MNDHESRQAIQDALRDFGKLPLVDAATSLFKALGYTSHKRFALAPNTAANFQKTFVKDQALDATHSLLPEWQSIDFLFQITDEEVQRASGGSQQVLFDSKGKWDGSVMQSYLFFAIALRGADYTRADLAGITRSVNRLFPMPVMVVFRHGQTLSLGIIRRRLHKRDESKDVLEKVTVIKDVRFDDPVRAHIEILNDLSLSALHEKFYFHNFVGLHDAWEKRLNTYVLNEQFYREVANWYFWALKHEGVTLPRSVTAIHNKAEREKQISIFFIRLLTRLIFCWFLQEKGLIPRDLFRSRTVKQLLKDTSPGSGTYYRGFLQNLFFATLNQERDQRGWRKKYPGSRDGNRGITNLYRYADLFNDAETFFSLVTNGIPFVNGGLFDCLDEVYDKKDQPNVRLDDFSEERANKLCIPNELFFNEKKEVDLTEFYRGPKDKSKRPVKYDVRGLIEILDHYKFTVEENTPLEQEIALDPELLGKVFENLLASYNEDTRTTARKALGGFYTPREIVHYMVDESLKSYLHQTLATNGSSPLTEDHLRLLFETATAEFHNPFTVQQSEALIAAIDRVKIIDPACGSGAFPMGALQRLVDLLQKLDPNNSRWKQQQLVKAESYLEMLRQADAPKAELAEVEARIEDIRRSFDTRFHALDFARKLYLIENCIYGVDILPIACQIAKLRFFIALIVDQKFDPQAENLGVRPLPNLETKIVAADSLVPINKPREQQFELVDLRIPKLRRDLEKVRHDHFNARTRARKDRCRERDAQLRTQIADLLRENGMPANTARALAAWDPYDQNHAATFFDPEWMFGLPVGRVNVTGANRASLRGNLILVNQVVGQMNLCELGEIDSGFDIVLGNPPYVRIQTLKQQDPQQVAFFKEHYESAKKGNYDLYVVFVERGLQLLRSAGMLAYILPHKFFNAQYGEPLRGLIAKGRHLKHVVHFGDQQVFPGATNYVCLLFLSQEGADFCRFVRADLSSWLKTFNGIEGSLPARNITADNWNFPVGRGSDIFERLKNSGTTLGEVAAGISQGIRTSANEVYVLDTVAQDRKWIRAYSAQLDREVILESNAVYPFLQGREIKPFAVQPSGKVVIIPYRERDGYVELIPLSEIERATPKLYDYLIANKRVLEAREEDRMKGPTWHAFIYPKNIEVMSKPKLLVPDIADHASFALDDQGKFAFTSGYGITLKTNSNDSLKFVLALANSRVLDFFWRQVSTPLRGGFYRYFTQFIEQLPIVTARAYQKALLVKLVDYLLWLYSYFTNQSDQKTARDTLMLGWWEQVLNGLVYELYFADDLHASKIHLFDLMTEKSSLPDINDIPGSKRLTNLRELFERSYDTNHPLRGALHALRSLDTVRIIEGEA